MTNASERLRIHQDRIETEQKASSKEYDALKKAIKNTENDAERAELTPQIDAQLARVIAELERSDFKPSGLKVNYSFNPSGYSGEEYSNCYFESTFLPVENNGDEKLAMWPIGVSTGFEVSSHKRFRMMSTFSVIYVVPDLNLIAGRRYDPHLDEMEALKETQGIYSTNVLEDGHVLFYSYNTPKDSVAIPLDYNGDLIDTCLRDRFPSPRHILELLENYKN